MRTLHLSPMRARTAPAPWQSQGRSIPLRLSNMPGKWPLCSTTCQSHRQAPVEWSQVTSMCLLVADANGGYVGREPSCNRAH